MSNDHKEENGMEPTLEEPQTEEQQLQQGIDDGTVNVGAYSFLTKM